MGNSPHGAVDSTPSAHHPGHERLQRFKHRSGDRPSHARGGDRPRHHALCVSRPRSSGWSTSVAGWTLCSAQSAGQAEGVGVPHGSSGGEEAPRASGIGDASAAARPGAGGGEGAEAVDGGGRERGVGRERGLSARELGSGGSTVFPRRTSPSRTQPALRMPGAERRPRSGLCATPVVAHTCFSPIRDFAWYAAQRATITRSVWRFPPTERRAKYTPLPAIDPSKRLPSQVPACRPASRHSSTTTATCRPLTSKIARTTREPCGNQYPIRVAPVVGVGTGPIIRISSMASECSETSLGGQRIGRAPTSSHAPCDPHGESPDSDHGLDGYASPQKIGSCEKFSPPSVPQMSSAPPFPYKSQQAKVGFALLWQPTTFPELVFP